MPRSWLEISNILIFCGRSTVFTIFVTVHGLQTERARFSRRTCFWWWCWWCCWWSGGVPAVGRTLRGDDDLGMVGGDVSLAFRLLLSFFSVPCYSIEFQAGRIPAPSSLYHPAHRSPGFNHGTEQEIAGLFAGLGNRRRSRRRRSRRRRHHGTWEQELLKHRLTTPTWAYLKLKNTITTPLHCESGEATTTERKESSVLTGSTTDSLPRARGR
uniref:Putative secreted peptide n=1 Tax=Anopheles braziliensis TaxID=58242 RepID=A0A2M3ZQ46_9DIPT